EDVDEQPPNQFLVLVQDDLRHSPSVGRPTSGSHTSCPLGSSHGERRSTVMACERRAHTVAVDAESEDQEADVAARAFDVATPSAISHTNRRPAPSWKFISPPGAMKPLFPKIVIVSIACSSAKTPLK